MNIVFLALFLLCIIHLMLQHQINHFLSYFINFKEQKCEKDIKLNVSSNGNDINFSVLGKF